MLKNTWSFFRNGFTLKKFKHLSDAEKETMYHDTWRNSLIPLCTNKSLTAPHLCSEFRPSLSNYGMCFTKNQAPLSDIYSPTEYMNIFNDAFLNDRDIFENMKNKGSGMRYKTAFVINADQVMDMKKGMKWNAAKKATFRLGIHGIFDMPEIRDTGIKINAGLKTIIRVNAIELESDPSVQDLKVKQRKCKFKEESEGMPILKRYSRSVYLIQYCFFATLT